MRALSIQRFYKTMSDLEQEESYYPDINFRYTLVPSRSITTMGPVPLDFSREHLDELIELGEQDALDALALGPRGARELMLEQNKLIEAGQSVGLKELVDKKLAQMEQTA